jgi:hypothetical protein
MVEVSHLARVNESRLPCLHDNGEGDDDDDDDDDVGDRH